MDDETVEECELRLARERERESAKEREARLSAAREARGVAWDSTCGPCSAANGRHLRSASFALHLTWEKTVVPWTRDIWGAGTSSCSQSWERTSCCWPWDGMSSPRSQEILILRWDTRQSKLRTRYIPSTATYAAGSTAPVTVSQLHGRAQELVR